MSEQVRAAVTVALDASMDAMVEEITRRVVALGTQSDANRRLRRRRRLRRSRRRAGPAGRSRARRGLRWNRSAGSVPLRMRSGVHPGIG